MIGRVTGQKISKTSGGGPIPEEQSSEWHDDKNSYLVCGVVGSKPKRLDRDRVKLMIDSGSQSTACGADFTKDFQTDEQSCETFSIRKLNSMARR